MIKLLVFVPNNNQLDAHADSNDISCLYTNADNLRNKLDELSVRAYDDNIDIILVTESLPKYCSYKVTEQEYKLANYSLVSNFEEATCHRGILVYVRQPISIEPITIDSVCEEYLLFKVIYSSTIVVTFLIIYRSPYSSNTNNQYLFELMSSVCTNKDICNLVIIGDFNCRDIDWNNLLGPPGHQQSLINCSLDNFLHQLVDKNTRFREGQEPSLLDLIFVKDDNLIKTLSYSAPLGLSDHAVLTILVPLSCQKVLPRSKRLLLNRGNYNQMNQSLQLVDWHHVFCNLSVNDMWEFLVISICTLTDEHVPSVILDEFSKPIWANAESNKAIKKKKQTFDKLRFVKSAHNEREYQHANRSSVSKTRSAKKSLQLKVAEGVKSNPKSFWNYVNSSLKVNHTIDRLECNGDMVSGSADKAACLNSFFASIFTKDEAPEADDLSIVIPEQCISDIVITRDIVRSKLDTIKVDKAAGPDGILPRVIYECREVLLEPLYLLFKASAHQGLIPNKWREATVVAIFKKGSKSNPSNYRPISLTSVICKLFESIVRDQLLDFCLENNKLSAKQFGFLPGKSCCLQLLHAVDSWINQIEAGCDLAVLYTDFSKAFDRVSHAKLMIKLRQIGVQGSMLDWIADFLRDRSQRVKLEEVFSHTEKVTSGVPQGSVLGPILFLIFIDDIVCRPRHGDMYLFADDAKMTCSIDTQEELDLFQKDIDELCRWSAEWNLSFNCSKCKVLQLGNKKELQCTMTSNDGQKILLQHVTNEEDLGVVVDDNLDFRLHIGSAVKRSNSLLGVIRRSFSDMGTVAFLSLYKSLIRPKLEYCSPVWSPHTVAEIMLIEGVQRRATCNVSGLQGRSYEERLKILGLPTLEYRRLRQDLIQVFRLFAGIDRADPETFFVLGENQATDRITGRRGHPRKITKTRYIKSLKKFSFSYRVVNDWNLLPNEVVMASNLNTFKSRLNSHYKNHKIKFCPSFMQR